MIKVARIKNLFWTNGSFIKPKRLPEIHRFTTLENQNPIMENNHTGWVILRGLWNYCFYNGRYYFLDPLYLTDEADSEGESEYKYQLIEDFWSRVLLNEALIKGILSKSTDEELLIKNLNHTIPIINNPAKIDFLGISPIKQEITYRLVNHNYKVDKVKVVGKKSWDGLIALDDAYKNKSGLFTDFDNVGANTSYRVFGVLKPQEVESWKKTVLQKLNEVFQNAQEHYGIYRVTQFPGTGINWLYTLSKKSAPIGTNPEDVKFIELDLMNLQDIVPISMEDLGDIKENEINKILTPVEITGEEFEVISGHIVDKPSLPFTKLDSSYKYEPFELDGKKARDFKWFTPGHIPKWADVSIDYEGNKWNMWSMFPIFNFSYTGKTRSETLDLKVTNYYYKYLDFKVYKDEKNWVTRKVGIRFLVPLNYWMKHMVRVVDKNGSDSRIVYKYKVFDSAGIDIIYYWGGLNKNKRQSYDSTTQKQILGGEIFNIVNRPIRYVGQESGGYQYYWDGRYYGYDFGSDWNTQYEYVKEYHNLKANKTFKTLNIGTYDLPFKAEWGDILVDDVQQCLCTKYSNQENVNYSYITQCESNEFRDINEGHFPNGSLVLMGSWDDSITDSGGGITTGKPGVSYYILENHKTFLENPSFSSVETINGNPSREITFTLFRPFETTPTEFSEWEKNMEAFRNRDDNPFLPVVDLINKLNWFTLGIDIPTGLLFDQKDAAAIGGSGGASISKGLMHFLKRKEHIDEVMELINSIVKEGKPANLKTDHWIADVLSRVKGIRADNYKNLLKTFGSGGLKAIKGMGMAYLIGKAIEVGGRFASDLLFSGDDAPFVNWNPELARKLGIWGINAVDYKDLARSAITYQDFVTNKRLDWVKVWKLKRHEKYSFRWSYTKLYGLVEDQEKSYDCDVYYFPDLNKVFVDRSLIFEEYLDSLFRAKNKTSDLKLYRDDVLATLYKKWNPNEIVVGDRAFWVNPETIKTGKHLFDLVGTDCYLFINENIPHIIYKDKDLSHFVGEETYDLGHVIATETSLIDLINSRYDLRLFNEAYTLTKKKDPTLKLKLEAVPLDVAYRDYNDYYLATLSGQYDSFINEISVPKAAARAVKAIDGFEYQRFLIDAARAKEDFKHNEDKIKLDQEKQDRERKFEYDNIMMQKSIDMANSIMSGLAMAGAALAATVATGGAAAPGLLASAVKWGGIGFGALKAGLGYSQTLEKHAMRLRRFDEEDKTIAAERALQKSRLETEWKRIEEDEKFRIRQMGALEEIPLVNSRGVMEAFNKKKTSKGVGNIHFKIYRPSEEQTKLIEEVYKNFGVDIYLPDHEMTLNKDIKEGVYQFSNINLVAHDDPIVRQYIEGILLNGIRVVDETNWEFI